MCNLRGSGAQVLLIAPASDRGLSEVTRRVTTKTASDYQACVSSDLYWLMACHWCVSQGTSQSPTVQHVQCDAL